MIQEIIQQKRDLGIHILHLTCAHEPSPLQLLASAKLYDLILAEDLRLPTIPVIWLDDPREHPWDGQIIDCVEKGQGRMVTISRIIDKFLDCQWQRPPVVGCILIGGKSTRMGHPKHLISRDGKTWLQRTASTLAQVTGDLVVVGQGELGECSLPRLPDIEGFSGPMAGLLSAMRTFPWQTILACACDMPEITVDALRWLLSQRRPGRRAVIPQVDGRYQPLLALYDFRIFSACEAMASQRKWRLSSLAEMGGAYVVEPPPALCGTWRNVNSPEMLSSNDCGTAM